jgi:RNA chaperone Hfq
MLLPRPGCGPPSADPLQETDMAEELAPSLQDSFLKHVQEHGVPVTVYLMSGVRLQGYVTGSDRFTLALTRDRQTQVSTSTRSPRSIRSRTSHGLIPAQSGHDAGRAGQGSWPVRWCRADIRAKRVRVRHWTA